MHAIVRVSVLLSVLVIAAPAVGRPLVPDDMYNLRHVSDARVSPDGGRVVYTVTVDDAELDEISEIAWSPDGKRPSFQLDKRRRYLAWYETYLK